MKTVTYVDNYLVSAYYKSSTRDPKAEAKIEDIVAQCNGTAGAFRSCMDYYTECAFLNPEDAERARCLLRPATSKVGDTKLFSAAEQELQAHIQAISYLLPRVEIQHDRHGIHGFARELFARFGMVIIETCSLEDVQAVRPDLTDARALDVLQQIDHDVTAYCDRTVSNGVIEDAAEALFPLDEDDEDISDFIDDDNTAYVAYRAREDREAELTALAESFGGTRDGTQGGTATTGECFRALSFDFPSREDCIRAAQAFKKWEKKNT